MAVRIRVYPSYANPNTLGMRGGLVSTSTLYNQKLQSMQQVSNLRLGYERALWNERLEKVRLEERLKNPYLALQTGFGGVGSLPLGLGLAGGLGGLAGIGGFGGMLPQTGMIPAAFGSGQTNITNQTSTGGASQSVTNSNVHNVRHAVTPHHGWGSPFGGFGFGGGSGGFLSGLLGALI
jgi:hypothetical protein